MMKKNFKYLLVFITPIIIIMSMYLGGIWSYLTLVYVFIMIPTIELFFIGTSKNMNELDEEVAVKDKFYDYILYSLVPIQFGIFFYFLNRVADPIPQFYEKIGMMISFGISCGALGINVAHELGHRNTWYEQFMSKMLLSTSQYMHFFIEHNRGHHKYVSTEEDPATGRYGETLYGFYIRSIRDSWLSAWKLENIRLRKLNKPFISFYNEMFQFQIIQLVMVFCIGFIFGIQVLLFYIGGATIGFLLLESINYIEHYGLRRKKINATYYEQTLPIHSWNSNHSLGRILLLEVTRHSDHHYSTQRKYQTLRHFDESPQLPTGYPGMMLLAFFPPLWFKVMHKQIEMYKTTVHGTALE